MTKKHDIIWLDSTDSTNNEAKRHISDIDNMSVLSALNQTSGRGQAGNSWSSAPGENLLFSIVLRFEESPFQAYDQFAISQAAALSAVDFLALHSIEAKIKWPNDIYVDNKKIGGILIENSLKGQFLSSSIVGIGINVNQTVFPSELPNPTSMLSLSEDRSRFDIKHLLEEFMDIFKRYHDRYLHINGGLLKLRTLYISQMWRKDISSHFIDCQTGREFAGTIRKVSDLGHLLIETEEGELREFAFKEIGYII